MRVLLASLFALCCLWLPGFAQKPDGQKSIPVFPVCTSNNTAGCGVSRQDLKQAHRAFQRGEKLKTRHPQQALEAFDEAAKLVPRNLEYATAREVQRQQVVNEYLRRGNQFMTQNQRQQALAEFRQAIQLDPTNPYASELLREVTPQRAPENTSFVQGTVDNQKILISPKTIRSDFHLRGDTQVVLRNIANTFGIKVEFDPSVRSRSVSFDVDDVDFFQAMDAAGTVTQTFWMPMSATEVLVAANTPAVHQELDRYQMRTFYLPEVRSPQELNDITNLLRTVFEIRFLAQQPATSTIVVRAPAAVVEAASKLLESMSAGRPQVMIDFEAFEIDRTLMRNIGLNMPLQLTVFNIPSSFLGALSSNTDVQSLINQLIASGGINQANSTAISALIAQLQNQQSSIFQNPLATFGGGKTLMGIGIPPTTYNFSVNDSHVTTLEHTTMRAAQGDTATFRLGQRYPILNSVYSPAYNSTQLGNILANNSYLAPFPSFNYEDLGVTLKAKPLVHGTTDVTLDLEMTIRSLGAQSVNGIPILLQRAYKGVISLKNNEPAVVAGSISNSELKTLTGLPGVSQIPGLNYLTSSHNNQTDTQELLIVMTPRIISAGFTGGPPAVFLPPSGR